jgi:8-oxo-dGTP pyrophosphatase MutT (NUDIX family)
VPPPRPDTLVARLPVPLRRAAHRAAHALLVAWWAVRRPHTSGVKCVVTRGDDVLLVRHTYGDRREWQLPGGGLRRGEPPGAAAIREAREELGITGAAWAPLGTTTLDGHKTTTLHAFHATHDGPLTTDPGEIAEARWFPLAALPQQRGPDVRPLVERAAGG